MRLRIKTAGAPLVLRGLGFVFTSYPFRERGAFASDDPQLKGIWDLCWHTARCCAHEHYEDCPFWEQTQYLGDSRLQALISYTVAGDDTLGRACLRAFDRSRDYTGLTQSRAPSNLPQTIPTFSLLYIQMMEDHFQYYGDLDFLRSLSPGIHAVLGWFEQRMTDAGLLGCISWWPFVDWAPEFGRYGVPPEAFSGPSTVINLHLVAALQSAVRLSRALGDRHHATIYAAWARRIQQAVRKLCWRPREGLYVDGPTSNHLSQHANAQAILTNTASRAQQQRIVKRLTSDPRPAGRLAERYARPEPIVQRPADGPRLVQTTYYYDFYLFQALLQAGTAEQLDGVLDGWRNLLAEGFSTCPERLVPSRSDCHAWSAWPMAEFQRTLLGVRPTAPGYAVVQIAPRPFGRLTEARGTVPTCRGEVQVAWKMDGERFALWARIPKGVPGEVQFPGHPGRRVLKGGEVALGDKRLLAELKRQ